MQRYDFTTQRIFVDEELFENAVLPASRLQANYILNVLRMKDGGQILLFNGKDGEWLAQIVSAGRKACDLQVISQTRKQIEPYELVYLFALLKKERLEYIVQKAVEMGVGVLQPVISDYTQTTKFNIERARANVIEAAEQCGILNVAQVNEPVKLGNLLDEWQDGREIVFCDETAEAVSTRETLSSLKGNKLALLVGPEGGFSDDERARLLRCEFVHPISLGPRILRADTAGVAALALLQSNAENW